MHLYKPHYARIVKRRKTVIPKQKPPDLEAFFLTLNKEKTSLCLEQKQVCVLDNILRFKHFFEIIEILSSYFTILQIFEEFLGVPKTLVHAGRRSLYKNFRGFGGTAIRGQTRYLQGL